tara:strand:+ start:113 stop:445 length:333 start_codon:yes stop_codon:yes gene_type:complete
MLKTITNKETGITYYPIFEESEIMGRKFFLDENFKLISAVSLIDYTDGISYDADNLDYVEDWECLNELEAHEQSWLLFYMKELTEKIVSKVTETSWTANRTLSNKLQRNL